MSVNAEGKPCGIGVVYSKQQQDAVFNIWLWQLEFKTPEEMLKVPMGTQVKCWAYSLKYIDMMHKGVELGVEALRLPPEEFAKYAKGSVLARGGSSFARQA